MKYGSVSKDVRIYILVYLSYIRHTYDELVHYFRRDIKSLALFVSN
jgi:hypothetical protein